MSKPLSSKLTVFRLTICRTSSRWTWSRSGDSPSTGPPGYLAMRRSATSSTPSRYRRSLARGGWRTPWAGDIRPVVAAAPRRATRARAASITWRTGTTSGARPTCGPIGWRATWPRPTPTSTGDTGIRNRDALYVRVPTGAHRARRRRGSRAWRPRQEAHWRFSGETPRVLHGESEQERHAVVREVANTTRETNSNGIRNDTADGTFGIGAGCNPWPRH